MALRKAEDRGFDSRTRVRLGIAQQDRARPIITAFRLSGLDAVLMSREMSHVCLVLGYATHLRHHGFVA